MSLSGWEERGGCAQGLRDSQEIGGDQRVCVAQGTQQAGGQNFNCGLP